jgi:acyl dehydratase
VLLEAPIASTLLRLAVPNVVVMIVQAAIGLIETYFVGKLGADALAGVSLVFPVVMLMQMMSAGGIVGAIFDDLRWPRPVRPGGELRTESEMREVRPSKSRPNQG